MEAAGKVLSIAGSDSGGGAGIQADIKTITLLGGYATTVITALTAQNTQGVQDVFAVPADFVAMQMESVLTDIKPRFIKTGMLLNSEIVHVVAERLRQYARETEIVLVVDPVMYSKSGHALLEEKARGTLIKELLPLATLVTPNIPETAALSGVEVNSVGTMHEGAEKVFELGPRNVLVKGGHLMHEAIDVLYDGEQYSEFYAPRIQTEHTHGTGCTFSAAITTFMAMGDDLPTAVTAAKEFISAAIESALAVGEGIGPVNPYGALLTTEE